MKFRIIHLFFLSGAMTLILLLSALFVPAYTSNLVDFDNEQYLNTKEQISNLIDREMIKDSAEIRDFLSLMYEQQSGSIELHNLHADAQYMLLIAGLIAFALHFFISLRLFRSGCKSN